MTSPDLASAAQQDVFPAIEDVLAKHYRGRIFERTTRDNVAAIVDRICELDAQKQQEIQRLQKDLASAASRPPDANCICANGEIEQLGSPDPLCRATNHNRKVAAASRPTPERDWDVLLSTLEAVRLLLSNGDYFDATDELSKAIAQAASLRVPSAPKESKG